MTESFSIKGVSKHTIIYGIGPIFQKSLAFVLLPVYTHYLTPSDYGILELISIVTSIWLMIANQGMGTAFFRYYPWEAPEKVSECVSTAFFYIFLSGAGLLLISMVVIEFLPSSFLKIDGVGINRFLQLALWSAFLQCAVIVPYQRLRAQMRSKAYVVINSLGLLVNLLLNIVFIVVYDMGMLGLLLGNMISALFVATALTGSIWRVLDVKQVSIKLAKKMVKYGYPLIPGGFSYFFLSIMDRIFIQSMSTTTDLGLYSLGARIANILGIVMIGPFMLVWPSVYFRWHKTEEGSVALGRIGRLFFGSLCWGGLGLSLAAPTVIRLATGSQFWGAYRYVPVLLVSQLCWGYFNVTNIGFSIENKTKYLPVTLLVATVMNAILNYLFILWLGGAMGAAVATAISFTFLCLFADVWARRYYKLRINDARMMIVLLSCAIPICLYYLLGFAELPTASAALAALAFLLVGSTAIVMTALDKAEIYNAMKSIKKIVLRFSVSQT